MADTPVVPPKTSPVITSANLPPAIKPGETSAQAVAPVAQQPSVLSDADIVAMPLVTPDFTNIQPANPAMSLRLINRLALGGQRFEEAKIQGFITCKVTDIKAVPSTMTVKDGCVTYGDLVVMMMPREKYLGAIKHNNQRARDLVSRQAVMGAAHDQMNTALNEVPGSRDNKAKIKLFQPDRD